MSGDAWASGFVYPNRKTHGLVAALFPRRYGRFLLTRLFGYVIWLSALAFAFVVFTAFASGRTDQAISLLLALGVIMGLIYEILAARRSRLHIFGLAVQLQPFSAAQVPVILILLGTAGWLLHKGLSSVPL